jgi:hypothetical protein
MKMTLKINRYQPIFNKNDFKINQYQSIFNENNFKNQPIATNF